MNIESNTRQSLMSIVEERVKKVHTQSLDISFNELADMHDNDELIIRPDYQRGFRWTTGQQSRFIESLILEMPIPAIYVVEEDDGTYSLIDGLQRISSYLHFRGKLSSPDSIPEVHPNDFLELDDCDIVSELNGKKFNELDTALQIRLKRSFIRVEVIRKGSDPRFKYFMFKRLNTGGALLSPQEVRNCTIRLLDPKFNDFLINMAENEDFKVCISNISEEQEKSEYDVELALRFFTFKNYIDEFRHDIRDFLTEYMEKVSDPDSPFPFDYEREEELFKKTFFLFHTAMEDKAFARMSNKGKPSSTFAIYHYEAFTIGIQSLLDKIDILDKSAISRLKKAITNVKNDPDFIKLTTGGGKNSPGPLRDRINFVTTRLGQEI